MVHPPLQTALSENDNSKESVSASAMGGRRSHVNLISYLAVALMAVVFTIDMQLPLGIAAGVPYIGVVLLAWWLPRPHHVIVLAIFASVLTVLGYFYSPHGGLYWVVVTNRGLSLLVIWITAILIFLAKKAARSLEESEARFRNFIDNSPTFINLKDKDGRFQVINEKHVEIFGVEAQDVLGKTRSEIYSDLETIEVDAHERKVIKAKSAIVEERTFPTKKGIVDFLVTKFPILDGSGDVTGIGTIGIDITERKKVEELLRGSEARLKEAQKLGKIGYWHRNLVTGKIEWSDQMYRVFGCDPETFEPTIEKIKSMTHPGDLEALEKAYEAVLVGKREYSIDHRLITPDKKTKWIHVEGRVSRDDKDKPVQFGGTLQDITERKRLEEQLLQAQKMEGIGQLTGGIAHDFNNLMGVIMGNLEVAKDEKREEERNELLSDAMKAVDRGASLTQQLLSFSRKQALAPDIACATELVADNLRLIKRTLGEDIEIQTQFAQEPLPINIDTAMFENALLNLTLNARDAMPDGGKLIVMTDRIELSGEIKDETGEPITGPYVRIMVSDTGHGIDKEQIGRVIEPFFTTKDIGKGSGLGLSMVHGFMEQSGGHMVIDSAKGKGTTVSLYVPVTDERADEDTALDASYEPKIQSKTILVVEDDPDVLKTTSRILTDLGYRVLEAADAPSAEEMLSGRSDEIDLVFADMVMPKGMNGVELAEWVKGKYDHIKVLLTSGYPDKVADTDYIKSSGVSLLAKPYRRAQLAKAIDEVFIADNTSHML